MVYNDKTELEWSEALQFAVMKNLEIRNLKVLAGNRNMYLYGISGRIFQKVIEQL